MRSLTEAEFWELVGAPAAASGEAVLAACWPWLGARNGGGYGFVRLDGRLRYAHHVTYERLGGPVGPGLVRRHRCGNPGCCNPFHIVPGTQLENVRDAQAAGTMGVLTPAQVAELRRRRAAGASSAALAREFGIHPGRVRHICARQPDSWREVGDDDGVSAPVPGGLGGAAGAADVPGEVRAAARRRG